MITTLITSLNMKTYKLFVCPVLVSTNYLIQVQNIFNVDKLDISNECLYGGSQNEKVKASEHFTDYFY